MLINSEFPRDLPCNMQTAISHAMAEIFQQPFDINTNSNLTFKSEKDKSLYSNSF